MNYNELDDKELDKLSAEMIEDGFEFYTFSNGIGKSILDNNTANVWRPCHPDSNQAERYLFPKLKDKLVRMLIDEEERYYEIKLMKYDSFL